MHQMRYFQLQDLVAGMGFHNLLVVAERLVEAVIVIEEPSRHAVVRGDEVEVK